MSLAADRRARIPFALVGVLLLVSSASVAATLATRDPVRVDARASLAVEEATANARTAMEAAVVRTGRAAARTPAVEPANTTYGRVLNGSSTFRDHLRIRAYVEMRRTLADVDARVGDVRAAVRLPPISDAASLRAAKRRVTIRATGDAAVGVRVRDLTVVVRRDGHVVDRHRYDARLAVRTPALALHRDAEAYQARLNRSPTEAGFARGLAARLHAIAWARGYAQYGGAPIANVVTNRHVEVATNGALLDAQRSTFGRSDPDGRRALLRASARVGGEDLAAGVADAGTPSEPVLGNRSGPVPDGVPSAVDAPPAASAEPLRVAVGPTADDAFLALLDGDPAFETVLDDAYDFRARLVTEVTPLGTDVETSGRPPAGWSIANVTDARTVSVEGAAAPPTTPPTAVAAYGRRVAITRRTVREYRRGNRTRTVETARTRTWRVNLTVTARPAPTPHAPARAVRDPFAAPDSNATNPLADVPDRAVERLVRDRGGVDRLARHAADGSLDGRVETIDVDPPSSARRRAYADLARFREHLRNVSVRVPRAAILDANPPARLRETLGARRADLVGVPDAYPTVGDRARVAARNAYVDRVLADVEARADGTATLREGLARELADSDVSVPDLDGLLDPPPTPRAGTNVTNVTDVSGTPAYLTRTAVSASTVPGADEYRYPMAARNTNLFAVPYGDAADTIVDALLPEPARAGTVPLDDAARTLRAANRSATRRSNDTLAARRATLSTGVDESLTTVRDDLRTALADRTDLPAADRRDALAAALARWPTRHERALAATNGSLADAVVAAPAIDATGTDRDRLRVSLRVALRDSVRTADVRVDEGRVAAAGRATRAVVRSEIETALDGGADRVRERVGGPIAAIPAGLPVTPVPGYWYATANVWVVDVEGRYARFAVRRPAATPAADATTYVRRHAPVETDVDGDGRPETIGRNVPVRFDARVPVVVVVPPGRTGVGDVDGDADERSTAWSDA